jgi:extracellular matrix regulatory protein A
VKVEFLHVGFDNVVAANRVVGIVGPSSAPVKRMIHEAGERGMVIDMTNGRKTKAVIILDSGHIALVALQPETIAGRANAKAVGKDTALTPGDPGPDMLDHSAER